MRYRGLRAPDATKDSIVVISRASAFIMDPVAFTATSVCPAGPGEQVWQLGATGVQPGDVVLVFERGVYHLSAAALRYRRGAGGRQPVTADVFDDDSTDVALEMIGRTPPAPTEPVAISLRSAIRSAGPAIRVRRSRIALLNTLLPLDSMEP